MRFRRIIWAALTVLVLTGCHHSSDIRLASGAGDVGAVQAMLDKGESPDKADARGATLLMTAARSGRADVIRLLLSKGAHPNLKTADVGNTALHNAAFAGHLDAVKALVEGGADVNATTNSGTTPLGQAEASLQTEAFDTSKGETQEVIDYLKSKGAK